jgi:hypothetical protein
VTLTEFLGSAHDAALLEHVWEALPSECARVPVNESALTYQCFVCRPTKLYVAWLIRRAIERMDLP